MSQAKALKPFLFAVYGGQYVKILDFPSTVPETMYLRAATPRQALANFKFRIAKSFGCRPSDVHLFQDDMDLVKVFDPPRGKGDQDSDLIDIFDDDDW